MVQLIDKTAVVAEIKRLLSAFENSDAPVDRLRASILIGLLSFINTLEVKEVDLDALGVLAEHLIACDAHLVTPKYTDKELDLLEEWAKNNKAQKGK